MALSRKNSFPHTIITQTGTLSIVLFGIIIPKGSNEDSLCLRRAFVVPSSCLRSTFAFAFGQSSPLRWGQGVSKTE